ncbi:acyl-CoA dehydratase activase [Campylobacter sp.]|uniref:acyl-CoA dehydratase activase n=1 Tax=Campylobacter sp. TaxID=205 RepID=UPI0026F8E745|nr:acyl-CoA dehydratase activase [Campylobacter sp.]
MYLIGIDIGSTSTKVAVFDSQNNKFHDLFLRPTGFNGVKIATEIYEILKEKNYFPSFITATGYGRVSVKYANFTTSEILCHALGANFLFPKDCTVIDVGGQDTKAIKIVSNKPEDFIMNDKCSAGTGKFIEVMATRLGLDISEIYQVAKKNLKIKLSSTCTVFAESEIVSLMASGVSKEEIAYCIIDSSVQKVASLTKRLESEIYFLSGGLSRVKLFKDLLSSRLQREVFTDENAIFCGAMGASLIGLKKAKS